MIGLPSLLWIMLGAVFLCLRQVKCVLWKEPPPQGGLDHKVIFVLLSNPTSSHLFYLVFFHTHTISSITASLFLQQHPSPGPERDDPLTLGRDWLVWKATGPVRIYRPAATFGAITDKPFLSPVRDEWFKWHSPLKAMKPLLLVVWCFTLY